jgi:predicted N-acetyltransferase YhbS
MKPYLNLLEESFPGIKSNVARCEKLGFPWASRPFLKEENGEIVSHVGLLEYPMLVEGNWRKVAALHAICTKDSHRCQGLASELIQEALNWTRERYEIVILYTEIPDFYKKLAFQHIQEYRFHLIGHQPKGSKQLRPIVSPGDDALFRHHFQKRTPLSETVWVKDQGQIASFNSLFATYPTYWSLHYCEAINGILSFHLENKKLHLFDVIADRIPPLNVILEHLPTEIEEIYFYFSPDRLISATTPEPYLYEHGYFMVLGNWPEVTPFMIPPLSRC